MQRLLQKNANFCHWTKNLLVFSKKLKKKKMLRVHEMLHGFLTIHPLLMRPRLSLISDSDVRVGRGEKGAEPRSCRKSWFSAETAEVRSHSSSVCNVNDVNHFSESHGKDPQWLSQGRRCRGTGVTLHGMSCLPPVILIPPPADTHTHTLTVPERKNLFFKNSKIFKELSTCLSGWEISIIITLCSQGLRPQMTCLCPEWIFADSL